MNFNGLRFAKAFYCFVALSSTQKNPILSMIFFCNFYFHYLV